MPTYSGNAYSILSQVRYGIGEYSVNYVQGTDASGAFKNEELIRQINTAQNYLWAVLFEAFPEYFLKSAPIVFTASVATLLADLFKIQGLVDSDGDPILPIGANQRRLGSETGDEHAYYRHGNTLRIDADGVTDTETIWYYSRCRELDTGLTSAGAATSATLATSSKAIVDYYNGMKIENVTDSTVDVITAYSVSRVCAVTNTWAASKYYGIVSDLPEIFQPLIAEYAVLQLKKNPKVPLQVTVADATLFGEMLQFALKSFAGTQHGDADINDIING